MADILLPLALPVVKKIPFYILGRVAKTYQRKWFPVDHKRIVISICEPSILINRSADVFRMDVPVKIRNFTSYHFYILSCECKPSVESSSFFSLSRHAPAKVAPDSEVPFSLEKEITEAEVRRLKALYNGHAICRGQFELTFALQTIYGLEEKRVTMEHSMELRIR